MNSLVAIGGMDAVMALIQNLDDPSAVTRAGACNALRRLPLAANIIVPALIRRLEVESESTVAISAIGALGGFGRAVHAALPAIHHARDRFNSYVVVQAVERSVQPD